MIENKIYFIRMADYTDKINNQFTKLSLEIFSFITFFLIIVFIATYFISLRIKKETDTILYFLTQLSNNTKTAFPINSTYTYEFNKITKKNSSNPIESFKVSRIEESLRILYVGITRAKEYLIISSNEENQGNFYYILFSKLIKKLM